MGVCQVREESSFDECFSAEEKVNSMEIELNKLTDKEKEIIIQKFRRADSWNFANFLLYKHLLNSVDKK